VPKDAHLKLKYHQACKSQSDDYCKENDFPNIKRKYVGPFLIIPKNFKRKIEAVRRQVDLVDFWEKGVKDQAES